MMESELTPVRCGCGGEAKVSCHDDISFSPYSVYCEKCFIVTDDYDTEAEAITAWNRAMSDKDINVPDKERTYKVTDIHVDEYYCPACGAEIPHAHEEKGDNYCRECGAKLDWGKDE